MALLGTERKDTCRGCLAGRDKQGPGCGKPFSRTMRVIRVLSSRFLMVCGVCGTHNWRKLKRVAA